MSQYCSFANILKTTTTRSRSASATPHPPTPPVTTPVDSRRASSSQDLLQTTANEISVLEGDNRILISNSVELSSDGEGADNTLRTCNGTANLLDSPQIPLECELNSLEDILRLAEGCRDTELEVEKWEKRIDQLERQRFHPTVSKTLVENVIHHRRRLRDLDLELYKIEGFMPDQSEQVPESFIDTLDESSDTLLKDLEPADDFNLQILSEGKFGSLLTPGQENTADILSAVPPPSSLQHKQYLTEHNKGSH